MEDEHRSTMDRGKHLSRATNVLTSAVPHYVCDKIESPLDRVTTVLTGILAEKEGQTMLMVISPNG